MGSEPGQRVYTDFDRLEEYSAAHGESFDDLGNWPATRFEQAWDSFTLRRALEQLRDDERAQVNAVYSNGMAEKPQETVQQIARDFEARRVDLLAVYGQSDRTADEQFYEHEWWKEGRGAAD